MGVYTIKNNVIEGLGLGEAASAAKAKGIHQRILKRICRYIDDLLLPAYEAVNEAEIAETNSEIPDIVIWSLDSNLQQDLPLIAIEITTNDYEKDNFAKLQLLFDKYTSLKECYLFNYNDKSWFQISKDGYIKENSISPYIMQQCGILCDFNEPLINSDIKNLFGLEIKKRNRKNKI